MTSMTPLTTLAVAATFGLVGCGDEAGQCNGSATGGGFLEGSYCAETQLEWTEVRTLQQVAGMSTFFTVEYVRPAGDGLEKTLIVSFDVSQVVPNVNEQILFLQASGTVRRVTDVAQDLTAQLDRERCTFTFTDYAGTIGSRAAGEFTLFFTTSGRNLRGEFEGTLVDPSASVGE